MLWHKTKSGTLVDISSYRLCRVVDYGARGFFLIGYPVNPLSNTEGRWPGGCDEVARGTREECEAELAAIEEKIRAATEPKWRMN